ncbi:hypothetical protein PTKIN_Ptkin09bG0171500 [Pterospermum kingtungense]
MVITKDAVWESYLTIYAKDRATKKDAQTAVDIHEDTALEENIEINEGTEHESQFELGSDDMDISSRIP